MKTIINIDIMFVDFPANVEFYYSEEEKQLVNVYKIYAGCDKTRGSDLIGLYHNNDEFREKINEELKDNYVRGDYEEA